MVLHKVEPFWSSKHVQ